MQTIISYLHQKIIGLLKTASEAHDLKIDQARYPKHQTPWFEIQTFLFPLNIAEENIKQKTLLRHVVTSTVRSCENVKFRATKNAF